MKLNNLASSLLLILLADLTIISHAQTPAAPTSAPQANSASTDYAIVQQDANSRVWQRTIYETSPSAKTISHIHKYTEMATGLNHLVNGQWLESKEEIDLQPDGTVSATNGQHQAYFPGDIYNGEIELVTPDGKQLYSRPVGLSYDDGTNSVLIAELTNSVGELVNSNQVIYPNAFTGLAADLRYTYTKAGFEQDIILREQPLIPESLGLNPATTRLQVLTEFFNPPQPIITAKMIRSDAGKLENDNLNFGTMHMVPGKAFMLGTNSTSVSVIKQWVQLSGRQFLVEEVPVAAVADELENLPQPTAQTRSTTASHAIAKHLILPPKRLVKTTTKPMHIAKATLPAHGLVLDYVTIDTDMNSYTFQADTTYYISGPVYLGGPDGIPPFVFEGGAVFKYGLALPRCSLNLLEDCPFTWQASTYRPIIFTTKSDNSVGETISGSTGIPAAFANPALEFQGNPGTLAHFRISYAQVGLYLWDDGTDPGMAVADAQFVNCQTGIYDQMWFGVTVENALFANTQTNLDLLECSVAVENATFANSDYLVNSESSYNSSSLSLTNCILANVTNLYGSIPLTPFNGSYNGFYNGPVFGTGVTNTFNPFQNVGGGSYYLTNGCSFFNAGTTNIDPVLLADLQTKTTYPPILYADTNISSDTTFIPQAQRDTNASPDLGYHYDPLD